MKSSAWFLFALFILFPPVRTADALRSATPSPAPAAETQVRFPSGDPGIELAGTIRTPEAGPVRAAAVLLPMAGPTDRDATLGPHTYLRKLAADLSSMGIATLRFDVRGVGESGGNLLETTLGDRAGDACAALEALRDHLDMPALKTGFIGISEGGGTGLLAAEACGPVDFGVLLSTPVRTGREVMAGQMDRMLAQAPLPAEQKEKIGSELNRFFELVAGEEPASRRPQIVEALSGPYGSMILPPYAFVPATPEGRADFVLSEWYQSQLHYDIREAVADAPYPVRALYGALDRVLDPERNGGLLRELNPKAVVTVLPGLNHLMQEAKTGLPAEYATLPESVSPEVSRTIGEWILGL